MNTLAFLLASMVLVVDDRIAVPAGDWRAVEIGMQERPGRVECSFQVLSGGSGVRVMLMTMRELQKLRDGQPYSILDGSRYLRAGSFSYHAPRKGDYVVVVDNRLEGRGPAAVHLKVAIDFASPAAVVPRYAPPSTRLTVVVLSTLFFIGVCTYFAKRFAG